jgi:adenylosuccinate synthase
VRELLKAEYGWTTKEEFLKLDGYVRLDFQRTPGNVHGMFELFMRDQMPIIVTDEEILNLVREFNCVWEGSQGVLLDEWKGFHPHTTWSTTTSQNALQLLSEAGVPREDVEVVGVTRTYHTRHGAGPFPSEDSKLLSEFPEAHNAEGKFQGGWRVGALDLSMLEYGIKADGEIDSLAVTHMDIDKVYVTESANFDLYSRNTKFNPKNLVRREELTNQLMQIKNPYRWESLTLGWVLDRIESMFKLPIKIKSFGPATHHKMEKVDIDLQTVVQ